MLLTTDPKLGSHMRGPATACTTMVVDFSSQKKGAKNPQVEVCSYLGNLFAVLPLVRYYWATFCRRQFRGFRASLVFTVANLFPPSLLARRTICVTFSSHFRVNSFTRPSQFSRKNSREMAISGRSHGLGSTVGGARAAPLCYSQLIGQTHTDTGFPHR